MQMIHSCLFVTDLGPFCVSYRELAFNLIIINMLSSTERQLPRVTAFLSDKQSVFIVQFFLGIPRDKK